jgi:hypothetical protein
MPHNPFLGGAPTLERPEALDPESIQTAMREAQSRELDFDPSSRIAFIKDHVRDIQKMIAEDATEREIRAKFPQFINSHPELFRKLWAREDISNLKSMIAMLEQMGSGHLTHHQASMIVGTRLAEKYLPREFRPSQQAATRGGRR